MNNEQIADNNEPKGEKPWPLIIMLVMLATVIGSGFLLVPKTEEGKLRWLSILGTNNYGELMNPPLELVGQITDLEGNPWSDDLEVPWKLVLVNQGPCLENCQEMADLLTRVHTRMNKLSPELKRGFLSLGANAVAADATLSAEGFDFVKAELSDFEAQLMASGAPSLAEGPLVFVMNPLQVFFLYYTAEHEGNGILEDVEHVIKLTK